MIVNNQIKTNNNSNLIVFVKVIITILLFVLIIQGSLNANETYSKNQIKKHLETIFQHEIKNENKNKMYKYIPFGKKLILYINFSKSIKNQLEKRRIIKDTVLKFEKITNVKIDLKFEKPKLSLEIKNNKIDITYKNPQEYVNEFIFLDFANREEIFKYLENGFWNKKIFTGQKIKNKNKAIINLKKRLHISIGSRFYNILSYQNFHLIQIDGYINDNFKETIEKEIFLSILILRRIWRNSNHIKPSVFNNKGYDFTKKKISEFDWIFLDEFYNNKKLKLHMFYKTEAIPILTEAIYKRINKASR